MKEMKKYHLAHHYKNFELGYGVTSEDLLTHKVKFSTHLFVQAKFGITYSTQSCQWYDLSV
jgi:hypothetical protein